MAKTEAKAIEKARYLCNDCNQEFIGSACPQCGSSKNLTKLAVDGISQQDHTVKTLFSDPSDLKPTEMSEFELLDRTEAAAAYKTLKANMRDAYVSRSEIQKKEAELAKLKKEAELNDMKAALESGKPVGAGPAASQQGMYDNSMGGMGGFPFGSAMSPQAIFMTKLMKMGAEERKGFLAELGEADPQALANLSAMLAQPAPVNMPVNPGVYNMSPWAQQQMWMQMMMNGGHPQQQQQQPQADPTEVALMMMNTMFELMQKMQPPRSDDSLKEYFRELKEEFRAARQEKAAQPQNAELKPVLDELLSLKAQVASVSQRRGLVDTVNEIRGLVEGLEAVGLVKRPGSEGRSVDEELALKKFDFEKETKQKELEIQEMKIKADKDRSDMGKTLLAGMMQRAMMKNKEGAEAPPGPAKRVSVAGRTTGGPARAAAPISPPEIIESYKADAGTVMETRAPVKRGEA